LRTVDFEADSIAEGSDESVSVRSVRIHSYPDQNITDIIQKDSLSILSLVACETSDAQPQNLTAA